MGGRAGPKNAPGADPGGWTDQSGGTSRTLPSPELLLVRRTLGPALAPVANRKRAPQAPAGGPPQHDRTPADRARPLTVGDVSDHGRFGPGRGYGRVHGNS